MKRKTFFYLVILVFSFQIFAQDKWETYTNIEFGYEISYPTNWEVIEAAPDTNNQADWAGNILFGEQIQMVTFLEKDFQLWQGQFQVCVIENHDSISLHEWVEKNEPTDIFDESLVLETRDTTLSETPAIFQSNFGFDHTAYNFTALHNNLIYSISFEGNSPNDDKEIEHKEIYSRMFSSFRFMK
ncbi:MAG: hypothetical protein Q8K98_00785 [Bacteroidota bacterium]|nr:hypothetical protein [Bacteroidota bacterium]